MFCIWSIFKTVFVFESFSRGGMAAPRRCGPSPEPFLVLLASLPAPPAPGMGITGGERSSWVFSRRKCVFGVAGVRQQVGGKPCELGMCSLVGAGVRKTKFPQSQAEIPVRKEQFSVKPSPGSFPVRV